MTDSGLQFEVTHEDKETHARTGRVTTPHGSFETPVFMPVGTQGTVKTLTPKDLSDCGAEIILGNTYHLYVRPGMEIIQQFKGLHPFMAWQKPVLTDSGGYQVFSLSRLRKITEEGVSFHSHADGREIFLSPELVMEIQQTIGSDIAMIFDDCPPPTKDEKRVRDSLEITLRWALRAKKHHQARLSGAACNNPGQALFGIVQGGSFLNLRKESLERTVEIGFDGYALGGLCVGENKEETQAVFEQICPMLPREKPRYLMGIGTPLDFLEGVAGGADMFDCVNPTRYGRNGTAFTSKGLIVVRNGKYAADEQPLDETCDCYVCTHFSRAYLRHLFNASEILGPKLVSWHNVHFFVNFVKAIRQSIKENRFSEFRKNFINQFDLNCR
ncbi:MAG: tRNA guanosine(34) transglycosylase Tgt [Candidatus Omnitrophica bacterium]|nr:tRNA guanosine(34) transglycosylase Tgt [Candidatus Omnitrophota bacterium]